jgi:hypothetical protein
VVTSGIHLSPFNVSIQYSPNIKAFGLFLYYFPNTNGQSVPPSPQAESVFLRTLHLTFDPPLLTDRTQFVNISQHLLLINQTLGTVESQAIGGYAVLELRGNEYPGIGISDKVVRTPPFRVLPCADCQSSYNVQFVSCSRFTICDISDCSGEDRCAPFITNAGALQNAHSLVAREGQQVTLFRQFERTVSIILHNQEGFVIVRPDSADELMLVEHHVTGDCTSVTFCANFHNVTDIAGVFASSEAFYVVVQATPI